MAVCLTIRISEQEKDRMESDVWFSEFMRYAGAVSRPERDGYQKDSPWIIKLYAPAGVDQKMWAKMNQSRLSSFGRHVEIKKI